MTLPHLSRLEIQSLHPLLLAGGGVEFFLVPSSASKLARIAWVIIARGEHYRPNVPETNLA